jgi:hypothetical protein
MSTYWTIKCQTCDVDIRDTHGVFWNHAEQGLQEFLTIDVPAIRVMAQSRPGIRVQILEDWGYQQSIESGWFIEHGPTHDVVVFNEYGETYQQWCDKFK